MSEFSEIIIKSFFKGIGQASGMAITMMIGWQVKNTIMYYYQFYPRFYLKPQPNIVESDHEEINDEDVKNIKNIKDINKPKAIRKLFDKL